MELKPHRKFMSVIQSGPIQNFLTPPNTCSSANHMYSVAKYMVLVLNGAVTVNIFMFHLMHYKINSRWSEKEAKRKISLSKGGFL